MDNINILEEMIKVRSWHTDPPEAGKIFNKEKEALDAGVEAIRERDELKAELAWWHNLIHKHHNNVTCPNLKSYVENLEKERDELKLRLRSLFEHHQSEVKDLEEKVKRLKE